jgi:2-C-methyl-D-erythritol 2,4-cyclodiphosphate synthase
LESGGPLLLGGVSIPHDAQAVGHSDADVLLHAVTDAILGAAALGDIGEMFPDDDEANRGRDSKQMLAAAMQRVSQAGYRIVNIDCVVLAQRPRISPHREAIRRSIADVLGIEPDQVSVKAKTGEHVGPIGREEAISAQCVVLLEL